jgi:hypothetical protein
MTDPSHTGPALCLGAILTLATAPLIAGQAAVGVYECTKNGVTTFSDQPCGPQEKHIEVDYQRAGPGAGAAAQAAEGQAGVVAQAQLLDTEILNSQQRISRLQDAQRVRIAELRQAGFQGNEQLDAAAFRAQTDAEIQATANRYQIEIDQEASRLANLQARRAALPPPQP